MVTGPLGDVRSVLHAADIFVLPTLYDPMPNAALEALASGLPVVTTNDAGIADAINDTGAGKVTPRDPEALADAMAAVLGDWATARQAALALRPRFALSGTVAKWLDLYGELS
jgi:UDP-glucose:(heptosyl)LPS alpha-1,3-glucosyltransferase